MSYRITEAERKHIAAIEDTKLYLESVPVEGQTNKNVLHIEDGDKLDIEAELPAYKFAVDKVDDKNSRIRLIDALSGTEVICAGYNDGTESLGLGWRYNITFTQDDDGYVNGIKLFRENDGKVIKVLTFNKISTFTVKDLVADKSFVSNGPATFNKDTVVNGANFEVNETVDTDGNKTGGKVSSKTIAASVGNITSITSETATVTDTISLKNVNVNDGVLAASNENVSFVKSAITTDEDTSVTLSKASIANAAVTNEDVSTSKIDSATITDEKVTSSNVKQLTVENDLTVNSTATFNDKVNFEKHINAKTLDADAAFIKSMSSTDTKTDALDATTETIDNSTIGSLNVTSEATVNGDLTAKANAKVSGDLTADGKSTLNTIEANESTIKRMSSDRNETTDSVVNGNETVSKTLTVNGILKADFIKTIDGSQVFTNSKDAATFGDNSKVLTLVTGAEEGAKETDEYYGHIKAIVNGKETYLATSDDINGLFPLGVVDKYTNQTITGIKTFNNMLVANAGIASIDEDSNVTNVISHVANFNEMNTQSNPEYAKAEAAKKEYDDKKALYDAAYSTYQSATQASTVFETATTNKLSTSQALKEAKEEQTAAESNYEVKNKALASQQEVVDSIGEEVAKANKSWSNAVKERDTKDTEVKAEQNKINAAKAAATYKVSTNEIVSLINAVKANESIKAATDLAINSLSEDTLTAYYTYDVAKSKIEEIKSDLDAADAKTSDESTKKSISDAKTALTGLSSDNDSAYKTATNESTLNSLKAELLEKETAVETTKKTYDTLKKPFNEATETLETYQTDEVAAAKTRLENANDAVEEAEKADSKAETELDDAEAAYNTASKAYFEAYEAYTGSTVSSVPETFTLEAPEKSDVVAAFENGDISKTVLDYDKNIIYLGDSEDELQIKTKALADGDEHIQATIGGKAHLLANVDDIVTGIGEDDKLVTDVSTDLDGKTVTISKTVNKLIVGKDGDKFEPETSVAGSLTVSDEFNISKDEDGGISLALSDGIADVIKRNAKGVEDVVVEDNKVTVKYNNDDAKEYAVTGDASFKTTDDGVKVDINKVNSDSIASDEVVKKYEDLPLSNDSLSKFPTALDAKLLHDDAVSIANNLAEKLQNRVPVAPNVQGTFNLTANVAAKDPDSDDISVTYNWSASKSLLPDFGLDGKTTDEDGKPFDASSEYGLKLKFVDYTNENGKTSKIGKLVWTKLA